MRSIPAWAGEPSLRQRGFNPIEVYPRVGGGTSEFLLCRRAAQGLSPRGRGNRRFRHRRRRRDGSIPAWAGEPPTPTPTPTLPAVYPRVGGGTAAGLRYSRAASGLSPRGRGNHRPPGASGSGQRSIPAWAGEPYDPSKVAAKGPVYPRVGGGTAPIRRLPRLESGLSPRGRGNLYEWRQRTTDPGSIPAWAGEPKAGASGVSHRRVYPRVGGGTGRQWGRQVRQAGLSPRGRGNLIRLPGQLPMLRSIPAWAGEPSSKYADRYARAVYPRVGGGTPASGCPPRLSGDLSPRGRGNPAISRGSTVSWGSIPAWAGEPRRRASADTEQAVYPRVGGGT